MKHRFRNLFVSFVIICLIVAVLDLLVDNPYSQKLLGIYFNRLIAEETNLSVNFESMSIKLIPIELDIFGVRVSPTNTEDEGASAEATQVKFRISLLSYMVGRPSIKLLHVDGLRLRIPPTFQGNLLKKTVAKKPNPNAWHIRNLSLENAQMLVDFSSANQPNSRLRLAGLNLNLNFKDWNTFVGKLDLASANLESKGKELFRGAQVKTQIQINKDNIALNSFSIVDKYFKATSNFKGTLELEKGTAHYLRVSGDSDIDANLQILEHLLDWKQTHGRGKIKTKLFLNIPFAKPSETSFSAEGKLTAVDGYLEDIRVYDSTSHFIADNNGVQLKDTKIIIDKKEYGHVSGYISFNEKIDFDFKGRIWDLKLSKIISSFGSKFEDVDFKTYSDNVVFGGTGEPFKMDLSGQAELAELDFPLIKIDRQKYQRIPNCYGNLNLSFTSKRLEFKDSDMQCFIPPKDHIPKPPKQKKFVLPASSMFASSLQLREYIDFDEGPHFSITGKNLEIALAQTYLQTDIGGTADLVSRIYETNKKLSITNTFATTNLSLMKVPFGNLKGTLNVLDHAIEWKDVTTVDGIYQAQSDTGTYDWQNDLLSFAVHAQNVPKELVKNTLSLLDHEHIMKLNFDVKDLKGTFTIPLVNLPKIDTNFSAKLANVEYDEKEIFKKLDFSNKTEDGHFHIYDLSAHLGSVDLTGDIKYKKTHFDTLFQKDDEIDASLFTKPRDPTKNDLEELPFISEYLAPMELAGFVNFDGKIKGPLSQLEGYFNANIDSITSHKYPVYPLRLKGFINHSNLQVFASQPGDNFLGRLDFNLDGKGIPFKWFFNLKQFDLRPFSPEIFNSDARNYAYLTAQWSFAGTMDRWWQSTGYLKLDDFNMAFFPSLSGNNTDPLFVKSVQAATVQMSDKGWYFEKNKNFQLAGSGLELQTRLVKSNPPQKLGLFFDTSFSLSKLAALLPSVQSSSGNLFVESSLDGPVENLNLKAHVFSKHGEGIEPLIVSVVDFNPVFQDIHVDLTYEKDRIAIKELSARKGKGNIHVNGVYDLNDKQSLSQVHMNFDQVSLDVNVPYLKTVHTLLGGKIAISGNERPYKVEGNLKIQRAQTERFLDIEGEIIKEYSAHRIGPTFQDEKHPLFRFNLAIEANKSIDIKSRTFSAIVSSNVSLKGTSGKPILNGLVAVDKGKFRYKRDFVISQGELIFDNPLRSDPKLNIIANAQTGPYTVTIFITGESSKPLIDIVVDPATKGDGSPISRLDAIVLLSTGRLPETDSRSQDTRGVVVSTGLNLYAAQLPFDKFNDLTGQSYISPYVNYTTDDQGNPVPQLNVPLHISEYIEALVQSIPGRYSATVQVPLHDNISVSGSASSTQSTTNNNQESSQTQSGFDVKFAFPLSSQNRESDFDVS